MKSFIKRILQENSFIYRICAKLNSLIRWYPNPWEFDILCAYATNKGNIKFLQIGSNNGMHGDPIYNYIKTNGWQGVLVEPVPYLFEELKNNYTGFHDKLYFENSAIANENGTLKFYRLKKSNLPGLPEWYDQLGSFNKEVVIKHRDYIPFFDELYIEDSVNAITFKELLKKYSIQDLNLLHIDTEGFDYEIIKMIPFPDLSIDLIMFEHKHLSELEYKKAIKILQKNKYKLGTKDGADTIAIKKNILKNLPALSKILPQSEFIKQL